MKGLILKDLYNMRAFAKTLVLIVGMLAIYGILMKSPSYICVVAIFMGFSTSITGFSVDEKANWDKYAMTLPVGYKMIVAEKMFLAISFIILGTLMGILLGGAITLFIGGDLMILVLGCLAAMGGIFLLASILIPIIFKIGAEKARYVMMGLVLIPATCIVLFGRFADKLNLVTEELDLAQFLSIASVGCILAGVVALLISYQISVRVYRKKEW